MFLSSVFLVLFLLQGTSISAFLVDRIINFNIDNPHEGKTLTNNNKNKFLNPQEKVNEILEFYSLFPNFSDQNNVSSSLIFEKNNTNEVNGLGVLGQIYRRRKVKKNTKTAYDIIKKLGATEFLKLASYVHIDSLLMNPNANITVFVPSNEALLAVFPNFRSNISSMDMIIRSHIAQGTIHLFQMKENGMLNTLAKYGQDTDKYHLKIRTNLYKIKDSKIVSVNGAEIVKPNLNGNGAIVHWVSKALYPLPIECIYYSIFDLADFSILKNFITKSITLLRVLCDLKRSITFFAPTNEAFKKLPADVFEKLQNDVWLLTKVFVDHIASNVYYSVGVSTNLSVKGVSGNEILLKKGLNQFLITVNQVTGQISIPDISCLNGVIHGIDTVLYSSNSKSDIHIIG